MNTLEVLRKENIELRLLINEMRNVLRYCARTDVGTYYQSQAAKEMLLNNTHVVWSHCNPDGTLTEKERQWRYECAESQEKGSGKKVLEELDEYEKELLNS